MHFWRSWALWGVVYLGKDPPSPRGTPGYLGASLQGTPCPLIPGPSQPMAQAAHGQGAMRTPHPWGDAVGHLGAPCVHTPGAMQSATSVHRVFTPRAPCARLPRCTVCSHPGRHAVGYLGAPCVHTPGGMRSATSVQRGDPVPTVHAPRPP